MLPFADDIPLSEESIDKLDRFYKNFSNDSRLYPDSASRHLDAVHHIIYACHAAFPLLLSPELANLTWLNFNRYTTLSGKMQKIDRVIVSDLLLSPLMQPLGARQFEMIPDIRRFLLHLLKNDEWFALFGIAPFGKERLTALANFLQQYLADKRSSTENNATGFREVNRWAAMGYLDPDALAFSIGEALKTTFDATGNLVDENGQLRINMLIDQFADQFEVDLHDKPPGSTRSFINLHRYSVANTAHLFKDGEEIVAGLFNQLDPQFISTTSGNANTMQLPVLRGVSEQLKKKKASIQRIDGLFISIDDYAGTQLYGCKNSMIDLAQCIGRFTERENEGRSFEVHNTHLMDKLATKENIRQSIINIFSQSKNEDIIVIGFSGYALADRSMIFPCDYQSLDHEQQGIIYSNTISRTEFQQWLNDARKNTKASLVLVMDTQLDSHNRWVTSLDDIQLSACRTDETCSELVIDGKSRSAFIDVLVKTIDKVNGRINYSDLCNLVRFKMKQVYPQLKQNPVLLDYTLSNEYVFSNESALNQHYFTIATNAQNQWEVVNKDFFPPCTNRDTHVYDFISGEALNEIPGEIVTGENTLFFQGSIQQLDTNTPYQVEPEKLPLICRIVTDSSNIVLEQLQKKIEDIYTGSGDEWSSFKVIMGNRENTEPMTGRSYLEIYPLFGDRLEYELVFYPRTSNEEHPPPRWPSDSESGVVRALQNLSRYMYLARLKHPIVTQGEDLVSPPVITWAHRPNGNNTDLDESCYEIQNGIVVIKPLSIRLSQDGFEQVFCDIYLLFPDMEITKITTNDFLLQRGKERELLIDDQFTLKKIFSFKGPLQVKVLASLDSIMTEFSQNSINKSNETRTGSR